MRYGSVCSGIEAATAAWEPLGWEAAFLAEIEAFPSAVLAHHYPTVPNLGDITAPDFAERAARHGPIDVLVGGTPCQSFSVAGLRAGLADPRGNLALVFLSLVDRLRPRWVVWENVPGVLSSGGGRDFGAFLGALGQLGYGFAYRVLDARYFGVPQRRRRVFVVGHIGDWQRAAAVLFERACLSGDPAPRPGPGTRVAACLTGGADTSRNHGKRSGSDRDTLVAALTADGVGTCGADDNQAQAGHLLAYGGNNTAGPLDVATAVNAHGGPHGRLDFESETFVAHALSAQYRAGDDGTGRGLPLVTTLEIRSRQGACELEVRQDGTANALRGSNGGRAGIGVGAVAYGISRDALDRSGEGAGGTAAERSGLGIVEEETPTLKAKGPGAVAFAQNQRGELRESDVAPQLTCGGGKPGEGFPAARDGLVVRRLTPVECARLQGFPDDYLDLPGAPAADGPKYRALGNSMAVPVMRWLGERLDLVDGLEVAP